MGAMTENKIGGFALMSGAILMMVASLIAPGTGLVDTMEQQTDLVALMESMVDNSN